MQCAGWAHHCLLVGGSSGSRAEPSLQVGGAAHRLHCCRAFSGGGKPLCRIEPLPGGEMLAINSTKHLLCPLCFSKRARITPPLSRAAGLPRAPCNAMIRMHTI